MCTRAANGAYRFAGLPSLNDRPRSGAGQHWTAWPENEHLINAPSGGKSSCETAAARAGTRSEMKAVGALVLVIVVAVGKTMLTKLSLVDTQIKAGHDWLSDSTSVASSPTE